MDSQQKKLQRLIDAQTTIENLAHSNVAKCVGKLADLEKKIDLAKQTVSASDVPQVFADIHIRHIQRLVEKSSNAKNELIAATTELQSETVRTTKLKERLRMVKVTATREDEGRAILERLDWSTTQG